MLGEAVDRFRPALEQLDSRVAREIGRLRARYQLSLDEFRGLYVSDEQVDALLDPAPPARRDNPDGPPLSQALAADDRWAHVVGEFGLSKIDQELLLLALAPELDSKYEALFAYLNDDVMRKWPTADLAARLLRPAVRMRPILESLAPDSILLTGRVVLAVDAPAGRPALLNMGFALSAPTSRFLLGVPISGANVTSVTHHGSTETLLSATQLDRLHTTAALIARRHRDAPALVILGSDSATRLQAATVIARALGMRLRVVDVSRIGREPYQVAEAVAYIRLEGRLEPVALCARGLKAFCESDGRVPPLLESALEELVGLPGPLIVVARTGDPWREVLGTARTLLVELATPTGSERLEHWLQQIRTAGLDVSDAECCAVADQFRFTPVQVRDAVATARDWRDMNGTDEHPLDGAVLAEAARAQARPHIGRLVTRVSSRLAWADLVLAPSTLARLRDLAAALQLRRVVYNEWGFSERLAVTAGVKALFAGPSGTGKSMAAAVIAHEIGLDLVKVDLSTVVSKYIGETEKNLDEVFACARAGNALLFFDEADALFGKRSEVKDAHDRYANIEVAYLLQKFDDYDSGVILATNLRKNIDDAFMRRLHYCVDFIPPDHALRERLWRGIFPRQAPLANDVDFAFLSRQFELSGGEICNVALDAAFLAAAGGGRIGMPHLVTAVARQLNKQGRTISPAEFQRYYGLIVTDGNAECEAVPYSLMRHGTHMERTHENAVD